MVDKAYLEQLRKLDIDWQRLVDKLAEARERQGLAPSFDYSREKVQSSSHGDSVIKKAVNIMDLEQRIRENREKYETIMAAVYKVTDSEQYELITKVYAERYSLERTAELMGISYDRAKRIHRASLDKIAHNCPQLPTTAPNCPK